MITSQKFKSFVRILKWPPHDFLLTFFSPLLEMNLILEHSAGTRKICRFTRLYWQTTIFRVVRPRKWEEGSICGWSQVHRLLKVCLICWQNICCWISLWKSKGCCPMGRSWRQNSSSHTNMSSWLHLVRMPALYYLYLLITWQFIVVLKTVCNMLQNFQLQLTSSPLGSDLGFSWSDGKYKQP